MLPRNRLALAVCLCLWAAPAFAAQDDDDILFELDEEEEEPAPTRIDEADEIDSDEDPDEDPDESALVPAPVPGAEETPAPSQFLIPEDEEDEFYEDGGAPALGAVTRPGEDNAALYRAQLEQVMGQSADEESLSWEQYLQTYPLSVFRDQIDARMDELSASLYGEGLDGGPTDAGTVEMAFSQGMLLEPIDPRSRVRAGFTWGFPNWINLLFDYEHQLQRQLAVHGGFQQRFSGPSLESGVRYAIIKSNRTNFILTAIGDFHLNLNPIAPGIRPQIATGKRFGIGKEGHIDLQAQVGPDLMIYPTGFSPRLIGGLNVTVSPSSTVKIFMETQTYMKDAFWEDGGTFRFNQLAFGMRFSGKQGDREAYDGGAGATVPYSVNYWRYHYGAVMGDFNYYL